ncbi:ATP-binding cassette domain-containing protein [Acidaminobacter sp. JC074]|uniref:ABC transporter ATP-binding protein n=1 Tax=Acidaminobacter sp. JC074 TaxID=2530199 RepID=UPI001F0ECA07|nr:ATP-binding cassette domain-containing protein [Acidaminobacter sp. JC074]MCH4887253.1 ATP-binding cassette domain-containing protein [Acidaminobacter sp. JC074]
MIEVCNLSKTFKVAKRQSGLISSVKAFFKPDFEVIHALSDINFKIKEGEIVGYIGPNGAGKSTTIKIMSGILNPSQGTCKIQDKIPWKNRIEHVKNIGVVFGQRSQLWWDVPVMDSYILLKDIYKIPDHEFNETLELLSSSLDIKDILTQPVRQLSLGQRMRCEIAASLLHNPKILFLDEPTIGLDAVSKIAVRDFIKTINKERKTTVILTTHDMSDIEALADRILLIGKGRLLLDGTLKQLKDKYVTHKILIADYHDYDGQIQLEGTELLEMTHNRLKLKIDLSKRNVSEIISQLNTKLDIVDLTIEDRAIDEVIVDLYKEFEI